MHKLKAINLTVVPCDNGGFFVIFDITKESQRPEETEFPSLMEFLGANQNKTENKKLILFAKDAFHVAGIVQDTITEYMISL